MRHIIPTLLSLIFITTACANPAVPASAPKEQIGMTSTPQVVPLENTAIATLPPEPTATATSVPPSHWYWGVASDDNLRVYLLTPDGMQKIALPSEPFYFDSEHAQSSRAIVAMHDDRVVF